MLNFDLDEIKFSTKTLVDLVSLKREIDHYVLTEEAEIQYEIDHYAYASFLKVI